MTLAISLFYYVPYQVIVIIYSFFHSLRNIEFRSSLKERIFTTSKNSDNTKNPIWIHSASVGEVRGLSPLVRYILEKKPTIDLIFTTTSRTGLAEARKLYPDKFVYFLPLDLCFSMSRFMRLHKPKLIIINETEIWPQLLIQAKNYSLPVLFVNGRISDRTYPLYLKLKLLFKFLLNKVELFGVQTDLDKERFVGIGADEKKVLVFGNTKFDTDIESVNLEIQEILKEFRAGFDFCISFGSVREEEEDIVLEALKIILEGPQSYSIFIAPRHPKRFEAYYDKLQSLGFSLVARSKLSKTDLDCTSKKSKIFYLDSLGEMLAIYKESDLAFVGGTFSEVGGHNILEPAYFGTPIVIGPRIETQREAFSALSESNAIVVVNEARNLGQTILDLMMNKKELEIKGHTAYNVFSTLRGASAKLYAEIERHI